MADVGYLKARRQTLRDEIKGAKEALAEDKRELVGLVTSIKERKAELRSNKEELNSINKQIKQLKNVTAEAA